MACQLVDAYARKLSYLRVSLTDRCQFRCVYCMPPEGVKLLPRQDVLRLDEFERLIRLFVELGVSKVRLTGGEPLLRHHVVSFVSELARLEGLEELALTTNGFALANLAGPLKEAGLHSINISLDSLDPERFAQITRRDSFADVWQGSQACFAADLKTKMNAVALSDLSEEEVSRFLDLACRHPVEIRFIEFMPLCGSAYGKVAGLSMLILEEWMRRRVELVPLARPGEVATTYAIRGAPGKIGFIKSLSEPFCGTCSRLRITSTGALRLCLFSHLEINLRERLRGGASDDELKQMIQEGTFHKPWGHEEIRKNVEDGALPIIRSIGG